MAILAGEQISASDFIDESAGAVIVTEYYI